MNVEVVENLLQLHMAEIVDEALRSELLKIGGLLVDNLCGSILVIH